MLSLQRVVDRLAQQQQQQQRQSGDERCLKTGVWVSLGAGSFWSSTSSRVDAERRLLQSRCNVLLTILPDEEAPCNPKRMSLRGNSVDDTIFPLGALFRVVRVARKVSSDLGPGSGGHAASRWPVYEIELRASVRIAWRPWSCCRSAGS
ncbi:unnamed protein product [Prorocentrum cordatum]|uniref:Uncharacterized protein n=1 Tax=Prorocentrum cordatum TaxID=2364126 RepID=A0ABN9Q025_9DINO|nr:unnamed protein product [Polarella glacialis]